MNFERHQDPKVALNIGIREKAYEVIERLITEEYRFKFPNKDVCKEIEEKFKEEVGIPISVCVRADGEIMVHLQIPAEAKIITNLTISPSSGIDSI